MASESRASKRKRHEPPQPDAQQPDAQQPDAPLQAAAASSRPRKRPTKVASDQSQRPQQLAPPRTVKQRAATRQDAQNKASPHGRKETRHDARLHSPTPTTRRRPARQTPQNQAAQNAKLPPARHSKRCRDQSDEQTDKQSTKRRRKPLHAKLPSSIGRRGIPQPSAAPRLQTAHGHQAAEHHAAGDQAAPRSPPRPFPHLAPRIHRLRHSTIEAKWSPLTTPSLDAVSSMLHLAHRPILQRISNTHQRSHLALAALRLVTHRISRKISRGLPFPPASMPASAVPNPQAQTASRHDSDGGRRAELNLETVLDAEAALEAQLQPAAHAVEALRREKEHMQIQLEKDYQALQTLEADARAHARGQRDLLTKAHPLVSVAKRPEKRPHDAGTVASKTSCGGLFTEILDSNDKDLNPLALQLSQHVESLSANLRPVDGVVPQLARSRAALQAVLLRHLSPDQYERVLLAQ